METRVIYTVDCGNTRTKVGVWHNDRLMATRVWTGDEVSADLEHMVQTYGRPQQCVYCSVSGNAAAALELASIFGVPAFHVTGSECFPLDFDYTEDTLGVDRKVAAVGAASRAGAHDTVLVVDVGTAVTYDLVEMRGLEPPVFRGGNIAPGIELRLRSLHEHTSRLPLVSPDGPVSLLGHTTEQAMRNGAVCGVVAEIEYYHGRMPAGTLLFLTGGGAPDVLPALPQATHTPDLMMRGLYRLYTYFEKSKEQGIYNIKPQDDKKEF
ncbi:MAG: type III pantothenate kinase [Muribaculaceae bacterium]|nr:type III pantothenate kinase [Muribaculaceae bacterium]